MQQSPEKLQEAAAIEQLILECVVGQIVELLQDEYLGHQDRRIRRPTALGARWPRHGDIDFVGQRGEVDMLAQADEWIARLRTSVSTFFLGKQAGFRHHHHGRVRRSGRYKNFTDFAVDAAEVFRGALKSYFANPAFI